MINGYFIVTLKSVALPANPCARRYSSKACICKSAISTWKKIPLNNDQKYEIGDFRFFKVNNDAERFLDVRITKENDPELTTYFVKYGKLHKLHFNRNKKGQLKVHSKGKKKLESKEIQPFGAPVVTCNDQVVGLLNKYYDVSFFN